MIKQQGLFLPLMLGFALLITATVIPLAPSQEALSVERANYRHAMWWHWQRAVFSYYEKYGVWPDSLTAVAASYQLPEPPSYLLGVREGLDFRLRWLNVQQEIVERISATIQPEYLVVAETSVELVMRAEAVDSELESAKLSRVAPATMNSVLSMANFDIASVNRLTTQRININELMTLSQLKTEQGAIEQLRIPGALYIDYFASARYMAPEIEALLNRINLQYQELSDYMRKQDPGPSPF
ncbi:hypothetical protein [Pseudidiomarina gelatinasegens]|jgi:hypothetical protein|uniref:hypothetical protein n=1 Tax=Pseudidiomarina gelatinasegens TaxID=2487740 RepID=UPI0030ED3CD9|tara:strand:- start:4476 stop:5198 length:723 start_codon:yes stop_codon:yes gene_type:complete